MPDGDNISPEKRAAAPDRRRSGRGGRRTDDKERQQKVVCPHCGYWDSLVTQGWPHPAGYTRRRKCTECGACYRTREILIIAKKIVRIEVE